MDRKLLTAKEVAAILQVDRRTVYNMAKDGRLRALKFGQRGPIRFDPHALDEMIEKAS